MPSAPPTFRPPGWRERKPWERGPAHVDTRKRGRAGQRERAQVLVEEPYCQLHLERGQRVRSVEVDHIVPLSRGGSDARANKQALCMRCHKDKSVAERAGLS